jgi:hypothetical protein
MKTEEDITTSASIARMNTISMKRGGKRSGAG